MSPSEGPWAGSGNPQAEWRMAVGRQVAAAQAGNRALAAFAVAGSAGAGTADQFSDLELDCYWTRPPSDGERLAPVRALGAELEELWDYDEDDREWSEDYRLAGLGVTVSNFLTATVDQFLDDVILAGSTDPVGHMRLAAIERARPLRGAELMGSWRARARAFPDTLVTALVGEALTPGAISGWDARAAFVSRGDTLAAADLLARAGQAVVRALLAVNRVYRPHRHLKWQRHLVTGLALAPDRLADRLDGLTSAPPAAAFATAQALLDETVALAGAYSGADLAGFRAALAELRPVTGPPG